MANQQSPQTRSVQKHRIKESCNLCILFIGGTGTEAGMGMGIEMERGIGGGEIGLAGLGRIVK